MKKTTYLAYYKMILLKVSFDADLFIKEYNKAAHALQDNEVGHLDNWLIEAGLDSIARKSLQKDYTTENKQSQLMTAKAAEENRALFFDSELIIDNISIHCSPN